ncbi:MAG: VacJ family lipoprotein [Methylovulum sp.]|nr:VacJ family lipoprotein [Methylovulum sp.]
MKKSGNIIRDGVIQHASVYVLVGMLMLGGCATTAVGQQVSIVKADPYESINRKIFTFNDQVDNYVAEPIARIYQRITPQFVQTGVFNFYNNLKNINVVVNDMLQAKFKQGAQDTGRFAVNSTLGLAGLFDVARNIGLEQNDEDFDQTMAVWGIPRGPYMVLPILGPHTARGIPGAIFDTAANPSSYVGAPVQLLSLLNTRANAEGALKFIDEAALDPYVFTRESFLQWRNSLATDGKSQDALDFDEELDDGAEDTGQSVSVGQPGAMLTINQYTKKFEQVSQSFSSVAQSFEATAKSFEDAGNKVDKLKD